MTSTKKQARVAGLLYFVGGLTAPFNLIYVPRALVVPGDATMAALLLISVPISLLNVLNDIAALILVSGAAFLSVFEKSQLDALAYLFLRLHGQGLFVAEIFWGLWLFPFGMLVIRSGFIPRALGVLLFIAGSGYLLVSLTSLLLPAYAHRVGPFALALEIGELPIILWLLISGAKEHRTEALAS